MSLVLSEVIAVLAWVREDSSVATVEDSEVTVEDSEATVEESEVIVVLAWVRAEESCWMALIMGLMNSS